MSGDICQPSPPLHLCKHHVLQVWGRDEHGLWLHCRWCPYRYLIKPTPVSRNHERGTTVTIRNEPELHQLVIVTDDAGTMMLDTDQRDEPACGSIVLTEGYHGTAWQRQFSTGKWHRVGGGRPRDWEWLLRQRRVSIAYDAPIRDDSLPECEGAQP